MPYHKAASWGYYCFGTKIVGANQLFEIHNDFLRKILPLCGKLKASFVVRVTPEQSYKQDQLYL